MNPRYLEEIEQANQRLVETRKSLRRQEFPAITPEKLVLSLQHQVLPLLQHDHVAVGNAKQLVLMVLQVIHARRHGPQPSRLGGAGKHGHLVDQRDAVLVGQLDRVGELGMRQLRHGHQGHGFGWHPGKDILLKMIEESLGVHGPHFHDHGHDRLAQLQQQAKELRRHLVVVALVGGDVDEDVGQAGNFEQTGPVVGRRIGGHVRAVPDDDMVEEAELLRHGRHPANLIDVLVEVGGGGRGQASQGAEEADVRRPVAGTVAAGVADGMARETGLGIGLGEDAGGKHVGDGALAGPGPAHDGQVQRLAPLSLEEGAMTLRTDAAARRSAPGLHGQLRLRFAVVFQPGQVFGKLAGEGPNRGLFHEGLLVSTRPGKCRQDNDIYHTLRGEFQPRHNET